MRAHLIPIGNSKGIRIPKAILENCGFEEDIEMIVQKDQLILRPCKQVRKGWEKKFEQMAAHHDDELLDKGFSNKWDDEEWEW